MAHPLNRPGEVDKEAKKRMEITVSARATKRPPQIHRTECDDKVFTAGDATPTVRHLHRHRKPRAPVFLCPLFDGDRPGI